MPGRYPLDPLLATNPLEYLRLATAGGAMVEGVVDQSLAKVRVVEA